MSLTLVIDVIKNILTLKMLLVWTKNIIENINYDDLWIQPQKKGINLCFEIFVWQALENKYTILRQKLLVDVLRIRMGTDKWEAQTKNEKEQKLMMLDSQALEQIKIGEVFIHICTDLVCSHKFSFIKKEV